MTTKQLPHMMLLKYIFCLFSFLLISFTSLGYEKRDLLQKSANMQQVQAALLMNKAWVPYPAYTDRTGWDKLTGPYKELQIKEGEKYLNYEWRTVKATDYMEFEKSGSRTIMEAPFSANSTALSALVLAELSEGKGRFIDQIINGVWVFTEITSWAASAHLISAQITKSALPNYKEHVIDLAAGDIGSLLSWVHYYFKDAFDKKNKIIAKRLKHTIQERILDTYMQRSDFWWQAFNLKPGGNVNNWNPWCNFNVLASFLLIEDDPAKLAAGVYRTMTSVDQFINHNHSDGACEEGPSYWGHAAGKMYDYLQLLSYATDGKITLFDQPIIKNMGEYISNTYVGNGWVVNFADASAKGGGDADLIYRYGKAVNSESMMHFAAYLNGKKTKEVIKSGRDLFRGLETMHFSEALKNTNPGLPKYKSVGYPETEFYYMKNDAGYFVAAKGGFNAESHNHNDMGTFSLFINETPVFIDAGVGTYTRKTFSNERYDIWTMQSDYHNLPTINGASQKDGQKYRSRDVKFDPQKQMLSLDISGAYPEKAEVQKWLRTYELTPNKGLNIEDNFELKEAKSANQVNFLVWQKPDLKNIGKVILKVGEKNMVLNYNEKLFTAHAETIPLSDTRLSNVWGENVFRITLTAKKIIKKGKYEFNIQEVK